MRKDKRPRAPSKQPICGLHAAAKCAGINLKTAADVEDFRKKCFAHGSPSALGFFSFLSYFGENNMDFILLHVEDAREQDLLIYAFRSWQ